ncbi:MAG: glycosyltransferase [Solirubrobacteraceae bacterium]
MHLVDTLDENASGGERAALGLATHLPQDRFDVHLCTTRRSGGEPLKTLKAAGVRHVDLGRSGRYDLRGHTALLRLVHRLRPDVLHAHMFGSNFWGSVMGSFAGIPAVIAHEQTWSYEGQPARRFIDGQIIGRLVDAFIAVSSADADRMQRLEGVPAAKIHMIPNAWYERRQPDTDIRAELGIAAGVPVAASVMQMRRQKRLDVMVDAFAHTLAILPAARLLIVGAGPEHSALTAHIKRSGLGSAISLLGCREDVDSVWKAADALLLSSDFEGTSLSVLEAMAAGVPVVSTDIGGMPDITDEASAILVPRRDPEALGAALARVLGDADLRSSMGIAAARLARRFTGDAHARRCTALYESLLGESAATQR